MINLYKDRNYKPYLIIPAILFAAFIFAIFVYPGITPGIDLRGGTEIRASLDASPKTAQLESKLKQEFQLVNLQIVTTEGPLGYRVLIQFAEEGRIGNAERLLKQAKEQNSASIAIEAVNALGPFASGQISEQETTAKTISIAETEVAKGKEVFSNRLDAVIKQELNLGEDARISRNEIGAVIGKTFWDTAFFVTLAGFLLISIVVFIFFREIIPSFAIIAAAVFDIACALALMGLFSIPLSLATIPALLMLIGYSVDTNILLTTRLLKRKEAELRDRAHDAMITGLTMTSTAIAALLAMLVLSYFSQIEVIFQISAIIIFGLVAGILSTWFMNAAVLLWYIEGRGGK